MKEEGRKLFKDSTRDQFTAKMSLQLRVDARRLRKISTNPKLQAISNKLLE